MKDKDPRGIKAPKIIVESGSWQQGRIPASAFPLSRSPIKLGTSWRWRVIRCIADTKMYRLLVAYRADKPNLWAWLAEEHGKNLAVICCLEDHHKPFENGIHCHMPCGRNLEIPLGAQRYRDMIRLPKAGRLHRRQTSMTDLSVLPLVLSFFRISGNSEDRLL